MANQTNDVAHWRRFFIALHDRPGERVLRFREASLCIDVAVDRLRHAGQLTLRISIGAARAGARIEEILDSFENSHRPS